MPKHSLTLGTKLTLSLAALAAVLISIAWSGWSTISSASDSFESMSGKTARKLELSGMIAAAEANMAVGQRGLILFTYAKDPARAAIAGRLFQDSSAKLQQAMAELRPLLVTDRGKQVASHLEAAVAAWVSAFAELERLAGSGDPDGATRVLSEKITEQYQAVGKDAEEMVGLCNDVMKAERQAGEDRFSTGKWFMILFMGVGAIVAAVSMKITSSATRELRQFATELLEGARQIAGASGQVASSSQSLAQGTSEQAATLEETSSSATEITAITQKNAENTRTAASLMVQTSEVVAGANHNLEEMVRSMKDINSSSEKISKIIRVIDEIAFQTNILALNAAVEAARAGEAGMGFAVVADEVRNLAHRSAQAAKDTAGLIEESIGKSNEGSTKLDHVAKSIMQITGSSAQVKTLVDEIDVGSQEQSRGIQQIATAVTQMEQVTQRSAGNAEESAAASEEMAAQAQSLQAIVERLRTLVGGATGESASASGVRKPTRASAPSAWKSEQPRAAQAALSAAATNLPHQRASFPLDDDEKGF